MCLCQDFGPQQQAMSRPTFSSCPVQPQSLQPLFSQKELLTDNPCIQMVRSKIIREITSKWQKMFFDLTEAERLFSIECLYAAGFELLHWISFRKPNFFS